MRTFFLTLSMFLCGFPSFGQYTDSELSQAAALRDLALEGNGSYEITASLTTEVGPRLAGTPADARAVAWAEAKLKSLGFDDVRKEAVTFPKWRRGAESVTVVSPFPQPLHVTALGFSVGTPKAGIEAEVVEVPTFQALTKMSAEKIEGKIVFINNRMTRTRNGSGYGVAVIARNSGASEAAKLGALAVLIRSIGTDSHRFPHTGVMRYQDGVKKIPAGAISNPDADLLEDMLRRADVVKLRVKLDCETLGEATSYNVIGDMRGRETPEKVVLLGAHLDSWDLGTGAIDDGAGVGIVVEAARLIGQLERRPRHTVRVVLFANEETGLFGAFEYAKNIAGQVENHVIAAESDFGAGRIWQLQSRVPQDRLGYIAQIASVLAPLEITLGHNQAFGGPDLIPLRPLGVPLASLQQDGTDYFDYHHTADDTLDKIDPKAMAQNVAAYAAFAYLAAETPGGFGILKTESANP